MPKNKIEDLRNHLFDTMERLLDPDDPMDLERAEAVAKVAQVVVNSAKVEVDFIKHTGHGGSEFIQGMQQPRQIPQNVPLPAVPEATDKKLLSVNTGPETHVDLCTQCPLPDCNDTSPQCLIQIEKRKVE